MNNEIDNKMKELDAIARMQANASILAVPIISDAMIVEQNNRQTIFIAQSRIFMEQLVADGAFSENESFEDRVNLVVNNTINGLKSQGFANADKNYFYYKDYSNSLFKFKIYVQDMIFPAFEKVEENGEIYEKSTTKVMRSINAFFVEPKKNQFYQLSLNSMPFNMPTEHLKVGKVDLENDKITSIMLDTLYAIMDGIEYRD